MKILMVCLGNICRSPLATGILRKRIAELKLDASVDSAGFEPYHIGDPADDRVKKIAAEHGINLDDHRARLFSKEDFDQYDLIYVMDGTNYHDVMFLTRNAEDKAKVDYIMNVIEPGNNKAVPDPYYGGIYKFQEVYELLDLACNKIAENLKK